MQAQEYPQGFSGDKIALPKELVKGRGVAVKKPKKEKGKEQGAERFICQITGFPCDTAYPYPQPVGKKQEHWTPVLFCYSLPVLISFLQTQLGKIESAAAIAYLSAFYNQPRIPVAPSMSDIANTNGAILVNNPDLELWTRIPGGWTTARYHASRKPRKAKKPKDGTEAPGKIGKRKAEKPIALELKGGHSYVIHPKSTEKALVTLESAADVVKNESRVRKRAKEGFQMSSVEGLLLRFSTNPESGKPNPFFEGAFGDVCVNASKNHKLVPM